MDSSVALSRIVGYAPGACWSFWTTDRLQTELYEAAPGLADPAVEARFVKACFESVLEYPDLPDSPPLLPVPPTGLPSLPWPVRIVRPAVDLCRLAYRCWQYHPDLVRPDEFVKFGIPRKRLERAGFQWTVIEQGSTVEIGLTVIGSDGREAYRLAPIAAEAAVIALSAAEILRDLRSLLF